MAALTLLLYDYVPDIVERRVPHRDSHLALLRRLHDDGRCVAAGAFGDPPAGAAFVFRSAASAEGFVRSDPYVAAGLVTAHRIEPWTVVVGEL